jgi:hypothetical protein
LFAIDLIVGLQNGDLTSSSNQQDQNAICVIQDNDADTSWLLSKLLDLSNVSNPFTGAFHAAKMARLFKFSSITGTVQVSPICRPSYAECYRELIEN